MKIGELVYNGHMLEIGHYHLGIVGAIHYRRGEDKPVFQIFWVDGGDAGWYYGNEVERIDATR
tara:strand:- start:395 stop:583 length:189 start_codon:yes stop_codon:yes gene_type:complete